jgi:hypothetical protein
MQILEKNLFHPLIHHHYLYESMGSPFKMEDAILGGDLEHDFYVFPYIGNVIIPTDFHQLIFFRGAGQPPTRM